MKKRLASLAILISALALIACGSGSSNTANNQDPQGFWQGKSESGYDVAAVVLENGQYYSIYSTDGFVESANYGTIAANGSSFSGNLESFYYPGGLRDSGTISGTVTTKSKLQGMTSYSNNTVGTFTTTYNSAYDTPATIGAVAGRYAGPTNKLGAMGVINIEPNGSVHGTTTPAGAAVPRCIISGTVAPRPSGKNVYDITLAWDNNPNSTELCCYGSMCANKTPTTGIAVLDVTNSSTLYTAWINQEKTGGFFWIGQKQKQ